jgi:hypothetical protein
VCLGRVRVRGMHAQYKIVPTPTRENTKQTYKVLTVSDIYYMSLMTVHVSYVIEVNESRGGTREYRHFSL